VTSVNYVDTIDGPRYILRIYNNGCMTEKVECEHQILAQLAKQKLSFETPRVLPSLDGKPYVVLSSGTGACVFEIIPGELAEVGPVCCWCHIRRSGSSGVGF